MKKYQVVRLDADIVDNLREEAKKNGRTLSGQIRATYPKKKAPKKEGSDLV